MNLNPKKMTFLFAEKYKETFGEPLDLDANPRRKEIDLHDIINR